MRSNENIFEKKQNFERCSSVFFERTQIRLKVYPEVPWASRRLENARIDLKIEPASKLKFLLNTNFWKFEKIFPSRWDIAIQSREVILKSRFALRNYL